LCLKTDLDESVNNVSLTPTPHFKISTALKPDQAFL